MSRIITKERDLIQPLNAAIVMYEPQTRHTKVKCSWQRISLVWGSNSISRRKKSPKSLHNYLLWLAMTMLCSCRAQRHFKLEWMECPNPFVSLWHFRWFFYCENQDLTIGLERCWLDRSDKIPCGKREVEFDLFQVEDQASWFGGDTLCWMAVRER